MKGVNLEEDLSVFAKAQVAYTANPTMKNKAILVLSMRVVLERARVPFTTKERAVRVRCYLKQIQDNKNLAVAMASWAKPGIKSNWPQYEDTGLL